MKTRIDGMPEGKMINLSGTIIIFNQAELKKTKSRVGGGVIQI